jgi:hypothetical protein
MFPKLFFAFMLPPKILYPFLIYAMHVTCLTHLIFLGLITLITSGEEYDDSPYT